MSLFACSRCDTIDNTALGNFHVLVLSGNPPLCSVCDPEINEWHNQFPRRNLTAGKYQLCPDYTSDRGRQKRIVCPVPDGWDYCEHFKKAQKQEKKEL